MLRASEQKIAAQIVSTARANGYRMSAHADSDCSYLVAPPGHRQWFLYRYGRDHTAGVVAEICKLLKKERDQ